MKKIYLSLLACIGFAFSGSSKTDLSIGNLSAGFEYSSSTGIIKDIYFTMLSNENDGATNFNIGIYLAPKGAGSLDECILIDSKSVNSISGNSSIDVSDWTIDLNENSDIESGSYRLLVAIDYDDKITESDENNNSLFISEQGDDLSYTKKGGNTGISDVSGVTALELYPNPVSETLNIRVSAFENENITCNVIDISGKVISTTVIENTAWGQVKNINVTSLAKGVYTLQLNGSKGTAFHRFVKM